MFENETMPPPPAPSNNNNNNNTNNNTANSRTGSPQNNVNNQNNASRSTSQQQQQQQAPAAAPATTTGKYASPVSTLNSGKAPAASSPTNNNNTLASKTAPPPATTTSKTPAVNNNTNTNTNKLAAATSPTPASPPPKQPTPAAPATSKKEESSSGAAAAKTVGGGGAGGLNTSNRSLSRSRNKSAEPGDSASTARNNNNNSPSKKKKTESWGPASRFQVSNNTPTKKSWEYPEASHRIAELSAPKKMDEKEFERISALNNKHTPVKRTASPEAIEQKCDMLYNHSTEQEKWRLQKKEEQEQRLLKELRAKPEVSTHAKKMHDRTPDEFLAAQNEWTVKRERKLAKIRERTEKDQEDVVEQKCPTLAYSKQIIEKKYTPCTDYAKKLEEREQHLQKLHSTFDPPFHPTVRSSPVRAENKSTTRKRQEEQEQQEQQEKEEDEKHLKNEPIGSRLYEQANKRRKAHEAAAEAKRRQEEELANSTLGGRLIRDKQSIEAHLQEMFERSGQSALRSEAKRLHDDMSTLMDETFTPFVTDRSRVLAEKHRMRKRREYQEQLLQAQEEEQRAQELQAQKEEEERHRRHEQASQRRENLSSFMTRNEKLLFSRRNLERTKEDLDFEREGKFCTFSPEINRAPKWAARVDTGSNVFERLNPQYDRSGSEPFGGPHHQHQQGGASSLSRSNTAQHHHHSSEHRPLRQTSPTGTTTSTKQTPVGNNNNNPNSSSYEQQFALFKEVQASLNANSLGGTGNKQNDYSHRQANQEGYSNPNSPFMRNNRKASPDTSLTTSSSSPKNNSSSAKKKTASPSSSSQQQQQQQQQQSTSSHAATVNNNNSISGYQSALDEWKALEEEAERLTAGAANDL